MDAHESRKSPAGSFTQFINRWRMVVLLSLPLFLVFMLRFQAGVSPNLPTALPGGLTGLGAWASPVLMCTIALGLVTMCILQLTKEMLLWRLRVHKAVLDQMGMQVAIGESLSHETLDLPTEKLAGQIALLADTHIALLTVENLTNDELDRVLVELAPTVDLSRVNRMKGEGDEGAKGLLLEEFQRDLEGRIQRRIDEFQVVAGRRWRINVRLGAILVSGALALLVTPTPIMDAQLLSNSLAWVGITGIAGGFVSSFFYDLFRLPGSIRKN